ncbi:hypothetical protein COU61_03965 [Candidatus Pacearchaeota archaeon CG10_big_fil_rev_8_21_14_0_10_35_13]|nr:MAG: hypothetical protein COU61_03965 [Candidatus Pacearchaeota archaeon CG10_big_fil_rev_8_21_14_0_10_35_13]
MAIKGFGGLFKKAPAQEEDYVEIDLEQKEKKGKVVVRPFVLRTFDDINPILNALREGYTIAVIDIKVLKSKDIVELKRSIAKIKKTVDALEGSVAGFGENTIIATPQFAEIYKGGSSVNN